MNSLADCVNYSVHVFVIFYLFLSLMFVLAVLAVA